MLKRRFRDGTVAIDMDPVSLLVRLAMSVPTEPPTFAPSRGPPFFKNHVVRRRLGEPDPAQAELFGAQ